MAEITKITRRLAEPRLVQAFLTSLTRADTDVSSQTSPVGTLVGSGDSQMLVLNRLGTSPNHSLPPNISVGPDSVFQLNLGGRPYPIDTIRERLGAGSLTMTSLNEALASNGIPTGETDSDRSGTSLSVKNDKGEKLVFQIRNSGEAFGRVFLDRSS